MKKRTLPSPFAYRAQNLNVTIINSQTLPFPFVIL